MLYTNQPLFAKNSESLKLNGLCVVYCFFLLLFFACFTHCMCGEVWSTRTPPTATIWRVCIARMAIETRKVWPTARQFLPIAPLHKQYCEQFARATHFAKANTTDVSHFYNCNQSMVVIYVLKRRRRHRECVGKQQKWSILNRSSSNGQEMYNNNNVCMSNRFFFLFIWWMLLIIYVLSRIMKQIGILQRNTIYILCMKMIDFHFHSGKS